MVDAAGLKPADQEVVGVRIPFPVPPCALSSVG